MALYDVVDYHSVVTFDQYEPIPDVSEFITLSVNFGTQQQPKIEKKWFRYDRDNTLLLAAGGRTITGEWCLSRCPQHIRRKDPWHVWEWIIERNVPESERHLALKVKRWDNLLDYRGNPRWELVYVRPSKRVVQPTSLPRKSVPQSPSISASKFALPRYGSDHNKMSRRSSSAKSVSPALSRSASTAEMPQYQNIDKKVSKRRSSTMSTSQTSTRSASIGSLPPPYDGTQVWPAAKRA